MIGLLSFDVVKAIELSITMIIKDINTFEDALNENVAISYIQRLSYILYVFKISCKKF